MKDFGTAFMQALRAVAGDRYALVTMVGAVLLYSVFYPAAYRHQVAGRLPVVVVDEDHSATSREMLRRMAALREVQVVAQPRDLRQARPAMEDGRAEVIVLLPGGMERDILRGGQGRLVLLGDGAYLGRASTAMGGLAEAITASAREAAVTQAGFMGAPAAPPVRLVQRPLYNTREGYGSSIVPGVAELVVHQTLLIGIGVLLGKRRRELGRRLHFRRPALLGMLAAFGLIGVAALLYYAGFTAWAQDYPRGGNFAGLLLAGPLFIAATVLFGMFVGSFFDTRERAFQYVTAGSIPLFFLANISWPAAVSPPALVTAAKLLPIVPGMNAMVQLNQMGARVREVAPELCNLALLVLLYGGLVLWRFRPMPAARQDAPHRRAVSPRRNTG
ncbi:ABC transporter permease [Luteimonas lutimaris]|uniref:ABC transporter permease n=1 Tax=Luteimonas lutimaris TaxID=698645 RepID=A0ABP7MZT4_9GAMM